MARKTGSDELFRLIHALSTEEKGYFKKFARRHTPRGNVYLQLFDTINKQKIFDESSIRKTFSAYNYKDLKLYLKDMITDSMVLYYKNNHPHIQLFNQLQKIHFLLVKGLSREALKAVEKGLRQSIQMELFSITQYFLRLQMELKMAGLTAISDAREVAKNYGTQAKQTLHTEENFLDNEILNLQWFINARSINTSADGIDLKQHISDVKEYPVQSSRAELKKLNTLNYMYHLNGNMQSRYELSKESAALSRKFNKHHDPSFNIVRPMCSHIVSCMDLRKIDEMQELCDQLTAEEANIKLYPDLAWPMINLSRVTSCFYLGQFKKALAELQKTEQQTMDLVKSKSDFVALNFQKLKFALLFLNGHFKECWMALQDVPVELKSDADSGLIMFEMMIQVEMGNFQLLPAMAKRAAKKLTEQNVMHADYEVMLNFFKQVLADNIRKSAALSLSRLKAQPTDKNQNRPDIFGLLRYDQWLEAKSRDTTLEEVMKASTAHL